MMYRGPNPSMRKPDRAEKIIGWISGPLLVGVFLAVVYAVAAIVASPWVELPGLPQKP